MRISDPPARRARLSAAIRWILSRPSLAGPASYGLALGAVGIAYVDRPDVEPPLPPPSLGADHAPSCPLPIGQQVKAVKAFGEMMPVFRHSRCFNCHGNFDIKSDEHEGSEVADNTGLNPRAFLTAKERQRLHEGCGSCHDNIEGSMTRLDGTVLSGWLVAPAPMLWNGKSDEELCKLVKRFDTTAAKFIEHIEKDHDEVQFIKAAFNGDRALGKGYKIDGKILEPEPPPGDQGSLVAKAQKWVDILGEGYQSSPECGCVIPKIKLQIHHRSANDPGHSTSRMGQIGFAGDAAFEVSLTPLDMDGRYQGPTLYYRGERSLVRPLRVSHARPDCRGTASQKEHWWFNAKVDQASTEMKLQFGFTTSDERGVSECLVEGRWYPMDLDPSIFADLQEIVVQLDSGATKHASAKELDGRGRGQEWLTVKVLEVPGSE